jgi:acetylornithine deacetylase/succinyl-diaminopimelate desuccinylase-like protein
MATYRCNRSAGLQACACSISRRPGGPRYGRVFCLLLLALTASAQPRYPVDWHKLEPEILGRFSELLRIDTSNPPGNETKAATAIKAMLDREGIPSQTFALDPARANLVARIKGTGTKRPILIMGHTDVVGVQRERWSVDPFAAINTHGIIYARGARDNKPHVIAGITILTLLKRMNVHLDRDVIFLAEAGEEGTSQFGIDYMIKEHWPEIDTEFAMAEGGGLVEVGGKPKYMLISTTEKSPLRMRLVAHGAAGHGSRPQEDNAVVHLADAVARAGKWSPPMRLSDTTRAYFERLATVSTPEQAARYRAILDPARAAEIDRYFRKSEPNHWSVLHTSVVPTIINIGFRSNVIPSEGEANLDVRILPDENMKTFVDELRKVINDSAIEIIAPATSSRPPSPPSRMDNEMFRALERVARRMYNVPTLPNMMTGATDLAQLRVKGVQCYGTGPSITPEEGPLGGAHSDNENIPVTSLMSLIEYLWNVVIEVG